MRQAIHLTIGNYKTMRLRSICVDSVLLAILREVTLDAALTPF